ncbi:MAG: CarD family transcriptional regulator [Eubacteriaceae bacterium]|nr:CarD family transcriptional regulator [Eubacteriaceae bacterium]
MYSIGEKIVYPMHGAGIIGGIESKTILGEVRDYYVLDMPYSSIKIMVPTDKCDEIGIRTVVDMSQIEDIMTVLKSPSTPMPGNWNKRHRENMEKLKSGDLAEVAEVVRNLSLADSEKSLSTGEKKVLNDAKQILLSEIMLVMEIEQDEADRIIDDIF